MIGSVDHVNIVVADIERMIRFYRDTLGLTLAKDVVIEGDWIEKVVNLPGVRARVVYLEFQQGARIELIHFQAGGGDRPEHLGTPNVQGLRHIAFKVDDIDAAVERLIAAGVELFSPVQQVPDAQVTYAGGVRKRLVYFHDPERNLLELCEYASR